MSVSHMSEEFHEWLDKCPVQWVRQGSSTDEGATYFFHNNQKEN